VESLVNTFHIDWKIIIAQIINFGIALAVLYHFALKPLNKLMKERTDKIEKGINDAKSNQEVLEKTKAEYNKVINQAKMETAFMFQEGKKEVETKKIAMMEKAKKEVASMIENGKKTLESEKIKMIEQARGEITSLAVKITEKLLNDKNDSYEEKAVKELDNI